MAMITRYRIPAMIVAGVILVLYVWLSAVSTKEPSTVLKTFATGTLKPLQFRANAPVQSDGVFQNPDGEDVQLADFKGRILVLNFWGTFCAPCVHEMPTLANLQAQYSKDDLLVMALSVDRVGDYPMARKQLEDLTAGQLDFYADPKHAVLFNSSIGGFPTTIIYDPEGREVARLEGDADWDAEESFAFFDTLLLQMKAP